MTTTVIDEAFQRNLLAGYTRLTQCVGRLFHSFSSPPRRFGSSFRPVVPQPVVNDVADTGQPFVGDLPPLSLAADHVRDDEDGVAVVVYDDDDEDDGHGFSDAHDDDGDECVTPPTTPIDPMFARKRVTINFSEFKRLKDARHFCKKCKQTKTKADFVQRQSKNYVLLQHCATCRAKSREKPPRKPISHARHDAVSVAVVRSGRTAAATRKGRGEFAKGRHTEDASDDEHTDSDQ